MGRLVLIVILLFVFFADFSMIISGAQKSSGVTAEDTQIRRTIDNHRQSWEGMNVPEVDGKALYDLIVQRGYKNALEIGTSNGYSGLWIAWALSKTGGKLITIEIDRGRYEEALTNFREAGLAKYIDARLGDAHDLVPALPGPFDFVFCDADKDWYVNYLKAVLPKLSVEGCFAAHNVSEYSGWGGRGRGGFRSGGLAGGYLEYARSLTVLETSILNIPGSNGLSVSYKKAK
jgi:caffeoyl-CoA O-methyltransferase